jgi:NOL1/NOP2/fmu family ribosome biogenesis protein
MIREDSLLPRSSRARNVFEPLERAAVAELWHSRFAIPESAFSGYSFFRKARSIWAISEAEMPRLSYEAIGMRIMNCKDLPWKPTTCALQIFGPYAEKNTIHLQAESARIFLEGKSQDVDAETAGECESGYVVVFYRGDVLGCGLYSHGKLVSQIPKELRLAGREGEDLL